MGKFLLVIHHALLFLTSDNSLSISGVCLSFPLVLQRSEVHSARPWGTAKGNGPGSCTYFLRRPVTRPSIVKHCALPTTLALSLPRDASESVWWEIETANDCLFALRGPDSLEAEGGSLGQFCSLRAHNLGGWCDLSDAEQKRDDLELCFLLKASDGNRWWLDKRLPLL